MMDGVSKCPYCNREIPGRFDEGFNGDSIFTAWCARSNRFILKSCHFEENGTRVNRMWEMNQDQFNEYEAGNFGKQDIWFGNAGLNFIGTEYIYHD